MEVMDEYKENEITLDDYFDDCKIICQDLYKYCDICINPMQTFWLNKKYSEELHMDQRRSFVSKGQQGA